MPVFARVPDDVQRLVAPFLQGMPWEDVDLFVQPIPQAKAPTAIVIEADLFYPHALRAVAMAVGTDIYIDPAFADFNTAAGLALLVHEGVHVVQHLNIPNFLLEYNRANQGVPDDRPWENVYEGQAYAWECAAFDHYVSLGIPPGPWLPLGKAMGICPSLGQPNLPAFAFQQMGEYALVA